MRAGFARIGKNKNEHAGSQMATKKQPPAGKRGKATPAPPPLVATRSEKVAKKPAAKKAAKKPVKKPVKKPAKPAARKARKPAKRKAAPKGNVLVRAVRWLLRTFFGIIWWFTWRGAIAGTLVLALWTGYYYVQLPPMEAQLDGRARGSVRLLDRYGHIFAWRGEQFDGSLRAQTVSPFLRNAVVATEDKRFYSHFGISPRGIAGAIRINLREGRGPLSGNGGSTITQQVAKLLCLGDTDKTEAECRRQSLWRKIQEMPFSFALEAKYSKDDILTIYLNRAYLGAGAYGFEAAAQRYFSTSARDLTAPESAMLAGLLTAPSYFAPTRNLERAQGRASVVIGLMEAQGYLTRVEADIARAAPATLSQTAKTLIGGDFADWVMSMDGDEVLQAFTRDTSEDVEILTTFDPEIQRAAEDALANVFATRVSEGSNAQAAIVVTSPDGAVRAIVGGRNIEGDYFNRATQARRQTGSSFKPFVYAAALEAGWSPNAIVEDAPPGRDGDRGAAGLSHCPQPGPLEVAPPEDPPFRYVRHVAGRAGRTRQPGERSRGIRAEVALARGGARLARGTASGDHAVRVHRTALRPGRRSPGDSGGHRGVETQPRAQTLARDAVGRERC